MSLRYMVTLCLAETESGLLNYYGATLMIKKIVQEHMWIFPFIFFFLSFAISFIFFSHEKRIVPSLIYQPVDKALELLAQEQLNCRLLKEQESNWPAGTVITQSPQPGKQVKAFQTIFITLAKPFASATIPTVLGLNRAQVKNVLDDTYRITWTPVYSPDIQHKCIAQINHNKEIILYESYNQAEYVLMPSLCDNTVEECKTFLKKYGIDPVVLHTNSWYQKHICTNCIVTEQHPIAGTIISLINPPVIQLKV